MTRPDASIAHGHAAAMVNGAKTRELVEAAGALRDCLRAAMQPSNPLPLGAIHPQHIKKATQGAMGVRLYELQPRLSPRFERFPHIRPWPCRRFEPKQPVVYAWAAWCSASLHDTRPPDCTRCCKSHAHRATGPWRFATTPSQYVNCAGSNPDHAVARGLPLLVHEPGRST